MPLNELPTIRLPKGTRFYIAAFLAVFFFFFTRPQTQQDSTTATTKRT